MKNAGKYIIWILGIIAWLFILMFFSVIDTPTENNTHQLILIITGICLAIYIFRKTSSRAKDLEKKNQELKAEVQKLRQKLEQSQAVQRVIDKTNQKKSEEEKK